MFTRTMGFLGDMHIPQETLMNRSLMNRSVYAGGASYKLSSSGAL